MYSRSFATLRFALDDKRESLPLHQPKTTEYLNTRILHGAIKVRHERKGDSYKKSDPPAVLRDANGSVMIEIPTKVNKALKI